MVSIRFPIGILAAVGLIVAALLLTIGTSDPAAAAVKRANCGETRAPKNVNGFHLERDMTVKAKNLDCHTAKKTLKKFLKNFNADDQTQINGFTCRIPQRGNGDIFYTCTKGSQRARGIPED